MESEKMKKKKRPTKSSSSSSLDSVSSSANSSSQCTPNSPNNKKRKAKVQDPDDPPKRTSIYRGVTKHRWTGRYEAHLWDKGAFNNNQQPKKGKQIYLGAFEEEEGAAHIYDLAALKYWGPSTTLNFPVGIYEKEIKEMERLTKDEYVASLRRRSCGFSRGVSKYRGVARHHHNGRWEARIGRVPGNKYMYLGTYGTQEEAAVAYDRAAIHYRGAKAVTNFDVSRYIGFSKNDHPPCHNSPATNEEQNVEQKHDRGETEKQEQKTITPPETIEFLKDEDCSKKNEEETIVLRETIEFLKDKDCSEKHQQESTVLPQTIEFLKDENCSEKEKQKTIMVPQTIEFRNDEDLLKDGMMNLMNEYEYQNEQSWTSLCLNADELCKLEVSDHVPREKPGDSLSSLFKDIDTGLEKYMDLKYNGPSSVENEFDNVDLFFNEPSYLKYEFNQYEYVEDWFVQILPMGDEANEDLAMGSKECVWDEATNLVDKEEKTKKQNVIPLSDDKRCPRDEASDLLDKDDKMNQNVTYSPSPSSSTTSIYGMF